MSLAHLLTQLLSHLSSDGIFHLMQSASFSPHHWDFCLPSLPTRLGTYLLHFCSMTFSYLFVNIVMFQEVQCPTCMRLTWHATKSSQRLRQRDFLDCLSYAYSHRKRWLLGRTRWPGDGDSTGPISLPQCDTLFMFLMIFFLPWTASRKCPWLKK